MSDSINPEQLMAEQLAEKSLQRFGFVVVGYKAETADRNIGRPTKFLWDSYQMPQPFVPIRKATEEEWKNQRDLAYTVFGRRPIRQPNETPLVLVTD